MTEEMRFRHAQYSDKNLGKSNFGAKEALPFDAARRRNPGFLRILR